MLTGRWSLTSMPRPRAADRDRGAGSLLALMTTREQVIALDAGISNRILLFSLALAAITSGPVR